MHLITEDPMKGKTISLKRKATSTAPVVKKGSMATALKNKIVDKVSNVMSAPARYKAEKSKKDADYAVGIAKKYREVQSRGAVASKADSKGVTGDTRVLAEFSRLKDRYK